MEFTKRRANLVDDWVERYEIIDFHAIQYVDKIVMIGLGKDLKTYKKVIR